MEMICFTIIVSLSFIGLFFLPILNDYKAYKTEVLSSIKKLKYEQIDSLSDEQIISLCKSILRYHKKNRMINGFVRYGKYKNIGLWYNSLNRIVFQLDRKTLKEELKKTLYDDTKRLKMPKYMYLGEEINTKILVFIFFLIFIAWGIIL